MMLFYLALAVPYQSKLLNFLEFANEFTVYFVLLMLSALETFSA